MNGNTRGPCHPRDIEWAVRHLDKNPEGTSVSLFHVLCGVWQFGETVGEAKSVRDVRGNLATLI